MRFMLNLSKTISPNNSTDKKDSGAGIAPLVIIIGGLAVVAILAVTWIGNSAVGVAADTTECMVASSSGDGKYSNNVCAKENDKSASASSSNSSSAGWKAHFGESAELTAAEVTAAEEAEIKLAQAKANLQRGIVRFGGKKSSVNGDASTYLATLRSATSKASASSALLNLRNLIQTANTDGEAGSGAIIEGSLIYKNLDHDAYAAAEYAQRLAESSNTYRTLALSSTNRAYANVSTLSMADLRSYADTIGADLSKSESQAQASIPKLERALTITPN